jgi:threonine/homoserine/homoserine lactone efflux protein
MLMTSGVKYGLGRTLPHLAGVILGFALMIAVVGLGLDILFERFPQILPVMRVAGSIYMVWLALKIALAKPIGEIEPGGPRSAFSPPPAFSGSIPKPG